MVEVGSLPVPGFSLTLRSWLRQAHASMVSLPYLVPLSLRGVPADAWLLQIAIVIMRGAGYVVDVAGETVHRDKMSDFWVWLRTIRPDHIPERQWLFVEDHEVVSGRDDCSRAPVVDVLRKWNKALRYPITIVQLAQPTLF
ncbi:wall-associated receptor kinase 5 [Hordeum vulgare]|nr:wall-associated receptor kinase 5 [Hordeum vulgare]